MRSCDIQAGNYYLTQITASGVRLDTRYQSHGLAPVPWRSVVENGRRQSGSTIAGHLVHQLARQLRHGEVAELLNKTNSPEFPDS